MALKCEVPAAVLARMHGEAAVGAAASAGTPSVPSAARAAGGGSAHGPAAPHVPQITQKQRNLNPAPILPSPPPPMHSAEM